MALLCGCIVFQFCSERVPLCHSSVRMLTPPHRATLTSPADGHPLPSDRPMWAQGEEKVSVSHLASLWPKGRVLDANSENPQAR